MESLLKGYRVKVLLEGGFAEEGIVSDVDDTWLELVSLRMGSSSVIQLRRNKIIAQQITTEVVTSTTYDDGRVESMDVAEFAEQEFDAEPTQDDTLVVDDLELTEQDIINSVPAFNFKRSSPRIVVVEANNEDHHKDELLDDLGEINNLTDINNVKELDLKLKTKKVAELRKMSKDLEIEAIKKRMNKTNVTLSPVKYAEQHEMPFLKKHP